MYYTSRAIEQHRQTKPSGEKWLALTSLESGLGPADTPELSRLTGAIKLRVQTDETSHAPLKIESDAGSNPPDGRAAGFVLHTPASSDAHQLRDGWWSRYHPAQQTILTQVVLLRRQVQAYLDTHTGFFSHERRPALADFNHRLEAIETALRGTQNAAPDQVASTIARITQGDLRLMTVAELKVNASEPLKKLGPSYQIILEGLAELHTRLARPLPSPGPDPLLPSPFVTQQRVLALAEAHSQFLPKFRTLGSELGGTRGEGIVRMAPQALYRPLHPEHNPDGSLRGLCDALTRAVLLDDSPGRLTVVNNLYQAMAQPDDAPSQRFRQAVERMNTPHHTSAMTRWQPDITTFDRAVDHLARQAGDARLALHLGDHTVGMRAWVTAQLDATLCTTPIWARGPALMTALRSNRIWPGCMTRPCWSVTEYNPMPRSRHSASMRHRHRKT